MQWAIIRAQGDQGGLVIANPIPAKFALSRAENRRGHHAGTGRLRARWHHRQGHQALPAAADEQLTGVAGLTAKIALLRNNPRLAEAVAAACAAL